jgi:hypothetical protein
MSEANFSGLTATLPPAARNGTHAAIGKTSPAPMDTFAITGAAPIDAPMWPLHAALWLQSEQAPSIPDWTGLAIERHNRIPAPDFQFRDIASPDRPGALDNSRNALSPGPGRRPAIPRSDLTPLGWDPRAVCRQQGAR